MLRTEWIDEVRTYDGSSLRSLFNFSEHGLLGNSCIAWRGPCAITRAHMADAEDLRANAKIAGLDMLHFQMEWFERDLVTGVTFQRLLAALVGDVIYDLSEHKVKLRREGDDLFCEDRKFSISIAARSVQSVLIHFAVNISREGTPVPVCALADWGLDPRTVADRVLFAIAQEFESMVDASRKSRPLP